MIKSIRYFEENFVNSALTEPEFVQELLDSFDCINSTSSCTVSRVSSLWVHKTQEMPSLQSNGVHA